MKISFEIKPNYIQKISRILIYFLVGLTPIFFLPFTSQTLDFSKQILFSILIFFSLSFYLVSLFISGKAEINFNFLNIPILALLFIYFLSTIFSLSPRESLFGFPLNTSQGFLTLFLFVIFYFLVSNLFKKEETFWLFFPLLISAFFLIIFSFFQIFGKIDFNPFGSLNSFSIFISILLPLSIFLSISEKKFNLILKIFSLSFLIFLILVNFRPAWFSLIFSSSILFIFGLLDLKKNGKFIFVFLPMLLLIISLFFLAFKISLPKVQIPTEISINQSAEFQIAKNSLKNLKNFFLGTGPATFIFNYSKFKPSEINQTVFWNLRFQNGASEIQDKLITTGILGILSLFFLIFSFLFLSLKEKNSPLIFSTFFAAFFCQFLYPANLSLLFLFWFLLSIFSLSNSKIKILDFSPKISLFFSFLFVLIFIFGISLSFTQIRNLLADIRYFQGIKAWQNRELDQGINFLERAIKLNPDLDLYQRDVSQLYLRKLNETLGKKEDSQKIPSLTFLSTNSAKRATEISKNDVANWNNLGFIYRNLISLVGGAEDWAIDSYQKAVKLEPKNPYIFNEMGLVYLAQADLAKAKDNFQKAIDLKPDYLPAHFQLGLLYYNV